jgi:hypothetical protein
MPAVFRPHRLLLLFLAYIPVWFFIVFGKYYFLFVSLVVSSLPNRFLVQIVKSTTCPNILLQTKKNADAKKEKADVEAREWKADVATRAALQHIEVKYKKQEAQRITSALTD